MDTEAQLVVLAQQGDRSAFDKLVTLNEKELVGLAGRIMGDHEEARDIAQEAFLLAWVNIKKFRGKSQFRTWLFRIAINQCFNFIKGKKRFGEPVYGHELDLLGKDGDQEEVLDSHFLHLAMESLPAKQSSVLKLKMAGMSHKEIGKSLGGTSGASRVNCCQAVKNLKKRFGEAHG